MKKFREPNEFIVLQNREVHGICGQVLVKGNDELVVKGGFCRISFPLKIK